MLKNRYSENSAKLAAIQEWIFTVITDPGGLSAGMKKARRKQQFEISELISVPADTEAENRLQIYAQGYWLRLLACLKADYPGVARLMGTELFEFFARSYLSQHPSRYFSLYDLGHNFPRFLRKSQNQKSTDRNSDHLKLPLDLARLEEALAHSARGSGCEDSVQNSIHPIEIYNNNQLQIMLPDTTRLLICSYTLATLNSLLKHNLSGKRPEKKKTYLAVSRMDYQVTFLELTIWQFYFLNSARRKKVLLTECARRTARYTGLTYENIMSNLSLWFPIALEHNLIKISNDR